MNYEPLDGQKPLPFLETTMSTEQAKQTGNHSETSTEGTKGASPIQDKDFKTIRSRLAVGSPALHNFDGDQRAQWKLTALATGGESRRGGEHIGEEIDLRYFYAHMIEMVSERDGEITDQPRCVLIDKGGKAYTFVSWGIIDSLDCIRQIFGDGPYDESIVVRISQTQTRKGQRTYNLVPV